MISSLGAIPCSTVSVFIIISRWACSAARSPTRGAFGTVGEVLQAAWPRCVPSFPLRGVPGTACTSGKPSLTMRHPAQPTPCLNRAGGRRVIPNTHTHTRARTFMQCMHKNHTHTHTHTHTTRQTPGGSNICLEDAAEVRVWV